ncbi:MAG TPA: hypothetical protein VFN56_03930 [Candidatus Saccharimonadales bacterium]|nr:hypothetical protein [Candidatus Saccharimonadales bacterium]
MNRVSSRLKTREWLRRYIPAEVLGTIGAVAAAWPVYVHTHSYLAAAASGWVGEGIGFYGYFITTELIRSNRRHLEGTLLLRVRRAVQEASTNLVVEFAPAEIIDNLIIRPYFMFLFPQLIHPYAVGFLVGKFSADILFYALAIVGYELRKHFLRR